MNVLDLDGVPTWSSFGSSRDAASTVLEVFLPLARRLRGSWTEAAKVPGAFLVVSAFPRFLVARSRG